MSKYKSRGPYHYHEFRKDTPYRKHVLDLIEQLNRQLRKHIDILLPKVIEIGAGEGLILREIQSRMGLDTRGCDIDQEAVSLAKQLGNNVELGTIDLFKGKIADVVLLCDVLEHVEDPISVMAAAREIASLVVIAVPDRHDPHAIHVVEPKPVCGYMEAAGWTCVHQSQRHARHLMIFERGA